ncbi:hypothetical protein N0M98_16665 [Paenibacillus doosanensis]|uniref:hypothetical protein n=1 Tax=Paenibacillus doosanensis TaxID=1229154 RepID=UPI00217F9B1D|nr:hypothetical protein [Paenibacillus doosanensis]MCS7461789.1 hypothetical protein [Paenibacillus doosanensis]
MKPSLRQTALFLSIAVFSISGCEQHPAQSNNAPNPALHTQNRQGETRSADDLMFPALTEQDIAKAVRPDPADQAPLQMPKLTVSDSSQQGQQDSSAAKPPEQTQASPAPAPVRQTDKKPVAAAKEKSASTATKKSTAAKRLTLAQLVQKYPDLLLLKGSSKSKQIALTFDDAPDTKYTLQVLDILKNTMFGRRSSSLAALRKNIRR